MLTSKDIQSIWSREKSRCQDTMYCVWAVSIEKRLCLVCVIILYKEIL